MAIWPLPWEKQDSETTSKPTSSQNHVAAFLTDTQNQFQALPPPVAVLITFTLGSATAMSAVVIYKRYGRRIRNVDWVTPALLRRKRWIKGVVTSVADPDNFRLYHTPSLGYNWPFKFRRIPSTQKELKDQTLSIRIAGVDAPEAGHFGKPAQPYAAESLAWLREKILGKTVYCQLLRKDQYSRIVAQVHLSPRILPGFIFQGKNLPAEMLKSGWAMTYEQAGAEYGKLGKEGYLLLQTQAQAARRGMWKDGKNAETPAEYKRRYADQAEAASNPSPSSPLTTAKRRSKKSSGWWSRLFSP
ncbi:staphylococcal nuclease [Phlegmacium glaucopus]|nr:staphylococcal nuclease [Phlegmacium glaucopus]